MQTLTQEQFKKLYGEKALSSFSVGDKKISDEATGLGGFVSSSLYNVGKKATEAYESVGKNLNRIQEAQARGKTGGTESLRIITEPVAKGIEAVFAPVTTLIEGGAGGVIPKTIGLGVDEAMKIPEFQSFASKIAELTQKYPQEAGLLGDITEIASTFLPAKLAKKPIESAIEGGIKSAKGVTGAISGGLDTGISAVEKTLAPVSTITKSALGGIKRIPSKVATNIGEKQAIEKTIQSLPTPIARETARLGVDAADISLLTKIPTAQKPAIRELFNSVKDFASGASKIRPEEVVGKPIVTALKRLDAMKSSAGQKLDAVADKLGTVSRAELFPEVFNSLKRVPGLSGLKIGNKGVLDFSETVLGSSLAKADRQAIQKIFTEAIAAGTGKQKHLLRQTLFEILGGQKKSLANITATQERAFEAVRKGLSNVLDTKNASYKALNAEFAKIVSPLSDLRKFMKSVGFDEDILSMKAGLLARRLTSNAPSNPQLRQILRNIDSALKKQGKTLSNLENLQDVYNVLDKYYDIAAKTGFQGQVIAGSEKALKGGDLTGRAFDVITGLAGETPAVRQKALDKLLGELLR